jgi:hypothetical protein
MATIHEAGTLVSALETGSLIHVPEFLVFTQICQICMGQGLRKEAQVALTGASDSSRRYEKAGGKHQPNGTSLQVEIAAMSKELDQSKEGSVDGAGQGHDDGLAASSQGLGSSGISRVATVSQRRYSTQVLHA